MSLITVEATVEPMDDTTSSSVDMRTLLPTEVITSMASSIMVVMESSKTTALLHLLYYAVCRSK